MLQLELFEQERNIEDEMSNLKKEWEKTRKSLYAKNAQLMKMYQEIAHEHALMKLHICKGKIIL